MPKNTQDRDIRSLAPDTSLHKASFHQTPCSMWICPLPSTSPALCLYLAPVPMHRAPKQTQGFFFASIFMLVNLYNDFTEPELMYQGTSDLECLSAQSPHTSGSVLHVLYIRCRSEAYSKQLSVTFTPSANTFPNP